MEANNIPPPHLSADEHLLRTTEEQLIKDGRQWLTRAAELYSHTSKIKIWVPVLGSILMTSYYMYTIHARSAASAQASQSATQSTPVAVAIAEETAPPKPPGAGSLAQAGAVADAPDADASDADLLQRAQQAHGSQQFADEAKLLQKVFDHSQSPQLVCPEIGRAYERAGEMDLSVHAFEQCTSLAPGNIDTLVAFGHALQSKSDFKRAGELYREGLQKDPGNLDAQAGLALVELKQNHLQEADHTALAILHNAPDDTDALLITGIVAWRQSRLADAERIFSRGVELDEHRADLHAFLGRVAEAQRRPQVALEQYERALVLDPSDSEIADRRDRLRDAR